MSGWYDRISKMKIYCKNKYWKLDEDYNVNKILYLLVDRPTYINSYNDLYWFNKKDQSHREYDLPAIIEYDGRMDWFKNNKFHRENNKPIIVHNTGHEDYWIID